LKTLNKRAYHEHTGTTPFTIVFQLVGRHVLEGHALASASRYEYECAPKKPSGSFIHVPAYTFAAQPSGSLTVPIPIADPAFTQHIPPLSLSTRDGPCPITLF
jgi:hypothetical protein